MITEAQLIEMQDRIANKKKIKTAPKNLFGEDIIEVAEKKFKQIFDTLIREKNYLYVKGNVKGKKNAYIVFSRWTGLSVCCNAKYDKKTKICVKCGNVTRSGKTANGIGLNEKALTYKKNSLAGFRKLKPIFDKHFETDNYIVVGVFFIRENRIRFDADNMLTMINDQMTAAGLIEDDSLSKLITIPMGYIIDKGHPGIILKIFNKEDFFQHLIDQANGN